MGIQYLSRRNQSCCLLFPSTLR